MINNSLKEKTVHKLIYINKPLFKNLDKNFLNLKKVFDKLFIKNFLVPNQRS